MAALFHILSPLILHLVFSEAVAWLLAGRIPDTGIVLISSVLILPAAAWMAMKERNCEQVRLSGHWKKAAACALSAAGGALMNAAVSFLIRRTSLPERFPDTVQKSLLSQNRILVLITLVIVVPVTEELIFRRLIYRRMRLLVSVRAAVLLNALLFAGWHGNVIQFVFAIPMGLLLCILYEKSGWLMLPVAFHAGSNLAAVLWR